MMNRLLSVADSLVRPDRSQRPLRSVVQPKRLRGRARALSRPVRVRVPGPWPALREVERAAAWSSLTGFLLGWRRRTELPPSALAAELGEVLASRAEASAGLSEVERSDLLARTGLKLRVLQSPTLDQWDELLRQYGPLWLLLDPADAPQRSLGGVILLGLDGDGTPKGTRVELLSTSWHARKQLPYERLAMRIGALGRQAEVIHWPAHARRADSARPNVPKAPSNLGPPGSAAAARAAELTAPSTLSAEGLRMIAAFEGYRAKPYADEAGHCTVGYGHLLHRGSCNDADHSAYATGLSEAQALALLQRDTAIAARIIHRYVAVPLAQHEIDALVSFVFNIGSDAFKESTLLKLLNARRLSEVPTELKRWNQASNKVSAGLAARREREAIRFVTPY